MPSAVSPASWLGRWRRRIFRLTLWMLPIYGLLAYVLLPFFWHYDEHQPAMSAAPKRTFTAQGIPGDPVNIGLVGAQAELNSALRAAGWRPADPLGLKSIWEMVKTVSLRESDPTAPVSSLYLFGRKEDLAYEQEAARTLRQRHHVRFWRADSLSPGQRPFWIGAATFDSSIGFSHLTGQILHHIAPDIDAERDQINADLSKTGQVQRSYEVSGIGPTLNGRNGEGDWYYTDGAIKISVLNPAGAIPTANPPKLGLPTSVTIKNNVWVGIRYLLAAAQKLSPQ